MGSFGFSEILIIGAVVFFLFGAKKIPDFAKSLGQGLKIFKDEMNKPESKNDAAADTKQEQPKA